MEEVESKMQYQISKSRKINKEDDITWGLGSKESNGAKNPLKTLLLVKRAFNKKIIFCKVTVTHYLQKTM